MSVVLGENDLAILSDEEKERLALFKDMFNTPGWTLVTAWAGQSADQAAERQRQARNWDEVLTFRAQESIYRLVEGMEEAVHDEFERLAAQRREDAAESLAAANE